MENEREGFYEKLWKDFVSLQRGSALEMCNEVVVLRQKVWISVEALWKIEGLNNAKRGQEMLDIAEEALDKLRAMTPMGHDKGEK